MKITSIDSTEERGVSHNPQIKKHVLLENGEVQHITNLSQAAFPPGETACAHSHPDMTEIFLIESGQGIITIDGESFPLQAGMCITVEQHEKHQIDNTSSADLVILCLGIKT
ncbi:MAG: cupin domain-containing protein [Desulfuromonas sp.]|nr:MAG: cupin domain-containing protein [Desulfuromonas sp.]